MHKSCMCCKLDFIYVYILSGFNKWKMQHKLEMQLKSKLGTCSFFKDKVTVNRASRGHFLKGHKDLPGTIYLSFALLGMKYHIKRQVGT